MKGTNLGEFEELALLAVIMLQDDAYIIKIQEALKSRADRGVAMGALHATLKRLEDKGFLSSNMGGASSERGGRRKRLYEVTAAGKNALVTARDIRNRMWDQVPEFALKISYG